MFPAASEDIAAAYRALLKDHRPENIGLYGCSAGGTLAAQAVAWLQKEGLPRPGAIAMICSQRGAHGQRRFLHARPDLRHGDAAAAKHPLVFRRLRSERSAGVALRLASRCWPNFRQRCWSPRAATSSSATQRIFICNSSRPASTRGFACGTGSGTASSGRRSCRSRARPTPSSPIFSHAIWGQHSGARAWPLRHCERSEAIQNTRSAHWIASSLRSSQ